MHLGTTEGLYERDMYREADIAHGSQKLLSSLWVNHPEIMRFFHIKGTATKPKKINKRDHIDIRREQAAKPRAGITKATIAKPPLKLKTITPKTIEGGRHLIQIVADAFSISYGELIGEGRSRPYVHARAVVIAVLRDRGWSYPRIGMILGNRDHSTIIHRAGMFELDCKMNPSVRALYDKLKPERPVPVV